MTDSRTSSGCLSSLICSTLLSFWFFLRVSIPRGLPGDPVQAAFCLLRTRPTPGPGIFVGGHGPGLGLAPDALVAPLEQRIDRHVVLCNVLVYPILRLERERSDLGRPVALLPGDHPRAGPLRGLLPAYPGHPRVVVLQRPRQRLDLSDLATQIGGAGAHLIAVALDLLLDRELRPQDLQGQLVAPHDLFAKLDGLPEEKARIYGEDRDLVGDLRDHVYERHPLRPSKRGRDGKPATVGLDRPLQDL